MAYKDPFDERNREARRKHYRNNKTQYYDRNAIKKAELRAFLVALKSYPCMDCEVSYPSWVMQFDHLPGEVKLHGPATLHNTGSWKTVITEIMKCDAVCANCHAQRTHDRLTKYAERANPAGPGVASKPTSLCVRLVLSVRGSRTAL